MSNVKDSGAVAGDACGVVVVMRGRLGERGFRRMCALKKCKPLDVAKNPAMAARRRAGQRLRSRVASQRRAVSGLSVCGKRIWFPKPVQFKGQKWRARCSTIGRSVALVERREFVEWIRGMRCPVSERRGLYEPAFESLCATVGDSLDAPILLPAGGCMNLSPFWFHGDSPPQLFVAREPWK